MLIYSLALLRVYNLSLSLGCMGELLSDAIDVEVGPINLYLMF
jgi:hypothetical protein